MERRNARAARSRAALKSAFLELFRTREPEEITVVDLCRKAGVNRSTFYAHYDYMDVLIREVLWESVKKVFSGTPAQWDLVLRDGGADKEAISAYIDNFLGDPTLRRFCTCAGSGNYRTLLIRAQIDLTLGPYLGGREYYAAYFHNAGVLNLLLEWIANGSRLPRETVVEIIHEYSKVMYGYRA
jgi:AcrR family transcriptional regulator